MPVKHKGVTFFKLAKLTKYPLNYHFPFFCKTNILREKVILLENEEDDLNKKESHFSIIAHCTDLKEQTGSAGLRVTKGKILFKRQSAEEDISVANHFFHAVSKPKMVFHRERYEMSTAYDDSTPISSDDILKSHSGKDSNTSSASSGKRKICFKNLFDLMSVSNIMIHLQLSYHIFLK